MKMIKFKRYIYLTLIRYWDLILISFITLGLVILLRNKDKEIPLSILATGMSLTFGIRAYRTENDKMFKELFESFNSKYDSKFNERLNTIIEHKNLEGKDRELIVDYLNFCSEEFLWYKRGRIYDEVWISWKKGMEFYFNNETISEVVKKEYGQKESYYGLFDALELKEKRNWG